jgi:Helicase HerA, central domain/TraM recognition site of TraD and TraG
MRYLTSKNENTYRVITERCMREIQAEVNLFYGHVTGITDDTQDKVSFGSSYISDSEELVKIIMKIWVKYHDIMLNECLYQKLDTIDSFVVKMNLYRGVTYDEFQMVLNTSDFDTISINDKEYKHFRAYHFFKIFDKIDRKNFILKNAYEKNNFRDYLKMLERYNIPILSFFLNTKIPSYFPYSALLQHSYLTAGSGSGKTALMKLIIYNLQGKTQKHHNATIIVFDPQGKFSRECLSFKMNKDHSRIIYIDLYIDTLLEKQGLIEKDEATFSPIINPFDIDERSIDAVGKMTAELTKAFEDLLKDASMTGNMDTFLRATISTLLFREGSSIKDLQRFMSDETNADLKALGMRNPIAEQREFFINGLFDTPLYKKTREALGQKVQQFLGLPNLARILVGKSTINLKEAVNSGKIILFNLSKGELTSETSKALGKIFLAMIQGIGFRRVRMDSKNMVNTFVICDEFQNFAVGSVKQMLDEIRQYKIGFFMAQQYAKQGMDNDFFDSIMANTTLKIIGTNDANVFSELSRSTTISKEELQNLPQYQFYVHNRTSKAEASKKYFKIKTPSTLEDMTNTNFYLTESEYKDLLKYLVFTSGMYAKDEINIKAIHDITKTTTTLPYQAQNTEGVKKEKPKNKPKREQRQSEDENLNEEDIPKPKFTL